VAVVDFDVHHGNGTEDIFRNDERVLMVSTFQHRSTLTAVSTGAASEWSTFHCQPIRQALASDTRWNSTGSLPWSGSARSAVHIRRLRRPSGGRHGFAWARGGGLCWVTQRIVAVAEQYADGRIVSLLEGHNLSALGRSVVAHLKVLAGV
jgi:hypothetical protein